MAYTKAYNRICNHCNKQYLGKSNQKYCSHKCGWKANIKRNFLLSRQNRVCKRCGETFLTKHLKQVYCSPYCRLGLEKKIINKVCPICKLEFQTISSNHIYCSKKCKGKNKQCGRTKNRSFINKVGKCEVCGNDFSLTLETHHYTKQDKIVLCGNCHNIWHHLSKNNHSDRATVITTITSALLNHQEAVNSRSQAILK